MKRPFYDPFPDTPVGRDLPIPCQYPYTASLPEDGRLIEPLHDTPIPDGWEETWMRPNDERLKDTAFNLAEVWIDEETKVGYETQAPGRSLSAWLILVTPEGVPVATWDEGRWWTPEESELFQLYLKVPGALGIDIPRGGEFGQGTGWTP